MDVECELQLCGIFILIGVGWECALCTATDVFVVWEGALCTATYVFVVWECVPCTATASDLVIPVWMIDEWLWGTGWLVLSVLLLWQLMCLFCESVEYWWIDTDRKPKNFENNLMCCLFVHHRSCVDWPCTQMQCDYSTLYSTPRHPEVHCCESYQGSLAWCDKNCIKVMVSMRMGETVLTGEHQSTRGQTFSIATLSTTEMHGDWPVIMPRPLQWGVAS
jgi:hypothetical protein